MKYRAFWKSTWYECEDYGALCRCLFWVGADSFIGPDLNVDSCSQDCLLSSGAVLVERVDSEV